MYKTGLALSITRIARELGRSFGEKVAQDAVERTHRRNGVAFPYFRCIADEIRDSFQSVLDATKESAHWWTAEEIEAMARDHFLCAARYEARRTRGRY